mgnify:CR=1 FL=1
MTVKTWQATVLTLFPEMFPGPLALALAGKALEQKLWDIKATNIRDFASDRHQTVDSPCYGGGPGMLLKPDVLQKSIDYVQKEIIKIIDNKPRMKIINDISGFIHATDVTPFFRFYDDIAIKIFEDNGKAVIWLQSQSRLGYYDFQVNEKRIQLLHREISSL